MSYAQKYSIFLKTILKKDNAAVSYRNERIARTSADKIELFNAVHYWAEHILTVAIYPWECSHSWISVALWVTSYVVFIDYIKGRHFVVILSITDIGHSWNEMQCPCYIIPYRFFTCFTYHFARAPCIVCKSTCFKPGCWVRVNTTASDCWKLLTLYYEEGGGGGGAYIWWYILDKLHY